MIMNVIAHFLNKLLIFWYFLLKFKLEFDMRNYLWSFIVFDSESFDFSWTSVEVHKGPLLVFFGITL